jgi:hypothetical protein
LEAGSAEPLKANKNALCVTERFRRTDFGHMELILTIDDPRAYRLRWRDPRNQADWSRKMEHAALIDSDVLASLAAGAVGQFLARPPCGY